MVFIRLEEDVMTGYIADYMEYFACVAGFSHGLKPKIIE